MRNQTLNKLNWNDCHHIGDLGFIIHLILQMKYLYHRMYLVSEKFFISYKLPNVIFSEGLKTIGDGGFFLTAIKTLRLPNSIISIKLFSSCVGVSGTLSIPKNIIYWRKCFLSEED